MDEFTLAQESLQLVRKDLGLEEHIDLQGAEAPYERLRAFLEKRVKHLLDSDFQGLLNALYRIDINEKALTELLELTPPDELSKKLSQAILDREKQKVITRLRYRQS